MLVQSSGILDSTLFSCQTKKQEKNKQTIIYWLTSSYFHVYICLEKKVMGFVQEYAHQELKN